MATLQARAFARNPEFVTLAAVVTGNGVSTNIAERGPSHKGGAVRIITAAGATPTATYLIEVSPDGTNWVAATWADVSTPTVTSTATFAITTTAVTTKIVYQPTVWRFVRVTVSLNTNVTSTIDFLYDDTQSPPWSF